MTMNVFLSHRIFLPLLIAGFALLFTGCGGRPIAYEYQSTPMEGWEPGDTLCFRIDTVETEGNYVMTLGVRTSSMVSYPFQTLWLIVTQQWHNPEQTLCDTVECRIMESDGEMHGSGVSIYQIEQKFQRMHISSGAWAEVSINHYMRREVLPGITNVGIRLERE